MLRRITLLAILFIGAPAFTADALAAPMTKEELKLEKEEVKYAKSVAKSVEKLAKKWDKNAEKAKDNAEIEAELREYYKNELAWLREKGVSTVEEPDPPQHPAHPQKVLPEPESETPKLEELRDICVELKKGELKDKKYATKLDEYVDRLWQRYERKDTAYDAHKASA